MNSCPMYDVDYNDGTLKELNIFLKNLLKINC